MTNRELMIDRSVEGFPYIMNCRVLKPRGNFNCIGWSLGVNDWLWPGYGVENFDWLNAEHGFYECEWDEEVDPDYDKIVLYAKPDCFGRQECTHQAKLEEDGTWTSKLGCNELVAHETLECVSGPAYGEPIKMYRRLKDGKPYHFRDNWQGRRAT